MKTLVANLLALAYFGCVLVPAHAVEPVSSDQPVADATLADTIFLVVFFPKVDAIYLGDVAHYTTQYQNISFSVFPRVLRNRDTDQSLINGPDAFFAVSDNALKPKGIAEPVQYCLAMLREFAINPNSELEMFMHLQVTNPTGVSFVVRKFHSCGIIQAP